MRQHTLFTVAVVTAVGLVAGVSDAARHPKTIQQAEAAPSVTTHDAVTIRGVVRKGATPVAGTHVWLAHSHIPPARTDEAGRFEFHGLHAGTYLLFAGAHARGTTHVKTHVSAGETADLVLAVRGPRPHYHRGGVATPGHTPGHVATPH